MNLRDMSIKSRLMLGFSFLAVVVVLVSGLAIHSLGASNDRFTEYLDGASTREQAAIDIRSAANRRAVAARNLVLVTKPEDREAEKAAVTKSHEEVTSLLEIGRASCRERV